MHFRRCLSSRRSVFVLNPQTTYESTLRAWQDDKRFFGFTLLPWKLSPTEHFASLCVKWDTRPISLRQEHRVPLYNIYLYAAASIFQQITMLIAFSTRRHSENTTLMSHNVHACRTLHSGNLLGQRTIEDDCLPSSPYLKQLFSARLTYRPEDGTSVNIYHPARHNPPDLQGPWKSKG